MYPESQRKMMRMRQKEYIFVYGSLRRCESNSLTKHPEVEFIKETRINGMLYAVSWYPGAKVFNTGPKGHLFDDRMPAVIGDLFRVKDESITDVLDAYEGHPDLFKRRRAGIEGGGFGWVYEYPHDVDESRLVASGDWKSYVPTAQVQVTQRNAG